MIIYNKYNYLNVNNESMRFCYRVSFCFKYLLSLGVGQGEFVAFQMYGTKIGAGSSAESFKRSIDAIGSQEIVLQVQCF